jgi:hypothetical protein
MDGTDLKAPPLARAPEARAGVGPSTEDVGARTGPKASAWAWTRARLEERPAWREAARAATGAAEIAATAKEAFVDRRVVVRVVEGPLSGDGPRTKLLFVGRERFAGDFAFLFKGGKSGPVIEREATVSRGGVDALVAQRDVVADLAADADVVAIEGLAARFLDARTADDDDLCVYPYLRATLPVAATLDDQIARIKSKGHQQKLRKALKSALTWRASRRASDFERFYDEMYVAHARLRFGDAACVEPKARLRQLFERGGDLVVVEKDGAPVAASLNYWPLLDPGVVVYLRNGMKDGAALSANEMGERNAFLELALVQHAIRARASIVDYDLTSFLLQDGVSTHKRRIGCDLAPGPYSPRFLLQVRREARAAVFAAHPLVGARRGALEAHVGFVAGDPRLARGELDATLRAVLFPGLALLRVYGDRLDADERARLRAGLDALGPGAPAVSAVF